MNGIELFQKIKEHPLKEILKNEKEPSKKGYLFEKIWDIVIKFGFCISLPNNKYEHYKGNINTTKIQKPISSIYNLETQNRGRRVVSGRWSSKTKAPPFL